MVVDVLLLTCKKKKTKQDKEMRWEDAVRDVRRLKRSMKG